MKNFSHIVFYFGLLFTLACGEEDITASASENITTVVIVAQTFVPAEITAAAGKIIYFYNNDSTPHHILSESAPDLFDDTEALDSGIIDEGDTRFITVPDTAIAGDMFYFYCDFTNNVMTTPNGTITVE